MANWKKVIVSGSVAQLSNLSISSNLAVTGSVNALGLTNANKPNIVSYDTTTGLFTYQGTGSFTATTASYILSSGVEGPLGMNSILSASHAVSASIAGRTKGTLSQVAGGGLNAFSFNGSTDVTVEVSGAAQLSQNAITKWNDTDNKFTNSSLFDNGTLISGSTSIVLTGANTSLTGSFTGSFKGDGSQLTGLVTELDFSGSTGGGNVDLLTQVFTITGTANEIETSAASQTLTIGLPNNVTIGNNLVVSNNLTVFGTASFQQTTNLEVADRFILLASGSNAAGDGGIVVQQGTQNVGELFAFDSGTTRWGLTGSFTANQSTYTPDAFLAAAVLGSSGDPTTAPGRYIAKGNIFIGNDETIWIYS